ncbi:MAG: ABC transporter ATP-binding protein [Treponema sp.]|nr:ABC transporter ATP-binding protein [Treponema sp.]
MNIDVQNLSFAYHGRKVLKEISLSLCPGEFLGLLGPNGSGKSTFLKNLLGYLKPQKGRIVFSGMPDPSGPGDISRFLAFVPQRPGLTMPLLVRDLVLMGRLPHIRSRWAGYDKQDRRKVGEVLSAMGIEELADRDVTRLSGGELQKVIICRCLVQEGEVFLLDEVTSGLDLNHSIEIMELVRRKADEEGKIIVAVFHDLNLASQYCDRVLFLKNGSIYCQGNPQEVLTEQVLEDIYGIRAFVFRGEDGKPVVLPRRAGDAPGVLSEFARYKNSLS